MKALDTKQDPIKKISQMLYKDLRKAGDTPQEALDKVVRAVRPLMRPKKD